MNGLMGFWGRRYATELLVFSVQFSDRFSASWGGAVGHLRWMKSDTRAACPYRFLMEAGRLHHGLPRDGAATVLLGRSFEFFFGVAGALGLAVDADEVDGA